MRALYVHAGNLYGGIESTAATIARYSHLCSELEIHFAICFEGRLSRELREAGATLSLLGEVRIRHPHTVRRARRAMKRLLQEKRFDAVLIQSSWGQVLFGPVIKAARVPLVYWLHEPLQGKHWLERWARRTKPDLALCNSKFTASSVHKIYPGVRVSILYNPVRSHDAHLSEEERAAVRAEFATPEDVVVILQVSRLEEWKGHAAHLRALSLLKDIPNWVCWQVGGAQRPHEIKYQERLVRLASELGIAERVRFLGERADVQRLMAAANIHCQPNSSPEPFGNVFVEALSARLPVITTATGGAVEIVNNSCGILVQPGDVQDLATSLRELIQDPTLRARLGAEGPERARELCDPETQLGNLSGILSTAFRPRALA
ncbi:MAG TPA: glycosyltransferase [Pyrinomonadaceae bacterium]|nr:glycosyltransferase [Pyrinomonadaceae bacterium]